MVSTALSAKKERRISDRKKFQMETEKNLPTNAYSKRKLFLNKMHYLYQNKWQSHYTNTSFLHHFSDENPYYYAPYNTSLKTGSQGFSDQT
jgi:hypothetical protein